MIVWTKQTKAIQNKRGLNDLISTGSIVYILISSTFILTGFILLCLSDTGSIKLLFIRLDQIPAAIVLNIGIIALVSTPVIQTIIALVKFSLDKDMIFVGISILILTLFGVCFTLTVS